MCWQIKVGNLTDFLHRQYWTRYIPDWHARHKTSFFEDRIRMNIETSFLEWWYWKDIWRLELLNKIQFTPWKNEPIFEKLLICHIFCLFFLSSTKNIMGKMEEKKEENIAECSHLELFFKRGVFFVKTHEAF